LERVEEIGVYSNDTSADDPEPNLVYSGEDQLFRATGSCRADQWTKMKLRQFSDANGNASVQRLTIRFLTPTFLRADGEVVRRPELHHLFKRLRDRINTLSTFFGDGPLDVDFKGLGERAEKVRTVSVQTDWVERFRTSSKTRQRHELSGFVGEASYEGELTEFLPWLAVGELVHVGKHAAWGNGKIELVIRF
jgi:CRISPR/Cas system endoribonuclease Cas6 (RAMP superfamily)